MNFSQVKRINPIPIRVKTRPQTKKHQQGVLIMHLVEGIRVIGLIIEDPRTAIKLVALGPVKWMLFTMKVSTKSPSSSKIDP